MNDFGDSCDQSGGIAGSTNDEVPCPAAGEIDVASLRAFEIELVNVADNANDGEPAGRGVERTKVDAVAKRVVITGPIALGHGLVDDDVLVGFQIVLKEEAAGEKRNPKGRKVVEAGVALLRQRPGARREYGLAFDNETRGAAKLVGEWKRVDAADFFDARQR